MACAVEGPCHTKERKKSQGSRRHMNIKEDNQSNKKYKEGCRVQSSLMK
jgi:hypothetical protein